MGLLLAIFFFAFLFGATKASARDGNEDHNGYHDQQGDYHQHHYYHQDPNGFRDGNGNYHHYGYYHHRRGYWNQNRNGVTFWINI